MYLLSPIHQYLLHAYSVLSSEPKGHGPHSHVIYSNGEMTFNKYVITNCDKH